MQKTKVTMVKSQTEEKMQSADSDTTGAEDITLEPDQVTHFERIADILQEKYVFVDTSDTGTGKTYTTSSISLYYGLPLLVVCPKGLKSSWTSMKRFGVEIELIITYDSLASVRGRQPKHGLLKRTESREKNGVPSFVATDKLHDLLKDGILLVLDECHNIKNLVGRHAACTAVSLAVQMSKNSRIACLSATPLDQAKHVINLLTFIGYLGKDVYIPSDNGLVEINPHALKPLLRICNEIDSAATCAIKSAERTPVQLCMELTTQVLKRSIFSSMPPFYSEEYTKDVANGYYNMKPGDAALLSKAIRKLVQATGYQEEEGIVRMGKFNTAITKALVAIENATAEIYIRVASYILDTVPGSKVVIQLHYTSTITTIQDALRNKGYSIDGYPDVLTGDTPEKIRDDVIYDFNNNPRSRIVIAQIKVGGVGISLHDMVGDSPRFMLLSSSYSIITMCQASGRTYRRGIKSHTVVRVVYGNCGGPKVQSILNALVKKRMVLEGIRASETGNSKVLFPDQYPDLNEDEHGVKTLLGIYAE